MFGDRFASIGGANEVESKMDAMPMDASVDKKETVKENMALAKSPGSIVFWLGLLVLYLAWDYLQNQKLKETLEPHNIRANIHNLLIVTIAAVIGINGMNVLLTKLTAMRIPVVSKAAGSILPLFHM